MTAQNCEIARNIYNTRQWSEGYFDINEHGHVIARMRDHQFEIELTEVVEKAEKQGLSLPLLVRFTDILSDRVHQLQNAFAKAFAESGIQGRYFPVYPIKVNQQRRVISQMLQSSSVGLESGSKAELLAILSLLEDSKRLIICNGYKDREYIRLALTGLMLGHQVVLIIEKKTELLPILEEAEQLGCKPCIGIRVRLNTVGKSNWQNTGGPKSKFGVTTGQCLQIIDTLKAKGLEDCLTVLHAHMGSQIAQLSDVKAGIKEIARWYVELYQKNIAIEKVDIGGGLGIDYEGTGSRHYCSMNYTIDEYAQVCVQTMAEIAQASNCPMPALITESGRAMTAHHAVLLTQIMDKEEPSQACLLGDAHHAHHLLETLSGMLERLNRYNAVETYHQSTNIIQEAQNMFVAGQVSLEIKHDVESAYFELLRAVRQQLDPKIQVQRQLYDELNEKLATKYFCNFSIFQSLPDIWAIDQIFPIMPIASLNKPTTHRGVIKDMTCDSDGRIEYYVDGMGIESTLPLPDLEPNAIFGVFLVGAYQEILGDLHNLFGDTDSVHVIANQQGFELVEPSLGETKEDVLESVQFDARSMIRSYREQLEKSDLSYTRKQMLMGILATSLSSNTYLQISDDEAAL